MSEHDPEEEGTDAAAGEPTDGDPAESLGDDLVPLEATTTGKVSALLADDLEAELTALLEDDAQEKDDNDLTYGDIVWTQFRKNRVAYISLWGLGFLFVLATFAPLLASTRPFYWSLEGETAFPWLASLFDRNFFENPVDLFFNILMVVGTPALIAYLLRIRTFAKKGMRKRPRRRKMVREGRNLALGLLDT